MIVRQWQVSEENYLNEVAKKGRTYSSNDDQA